MDPQTLLALSYTVGFVSFVAFALVGVRLFSKGWEGYESQYMEGAETTLEALYLTIPPQHLLYLSFLCFFLIGGFVLAVLHNPIPAVVFGGAAFFAPQVYLSRLKKKRALAFEEQLTGFITIMNNSLKAGHSLPVALEVIRTEMKNPMRTEIAILLGELRLGVSMEKALRSLFGRMPSEDLDLIMTAIMISEKVGGNLTNVLQGLEATIRERYKMNGKVRALTSQGKMEGFIVGLLPYVLGLAISMIDKKLIIPLLTTPTGWLMIAAIFFLDLIGILVIQSIVTIEF
ncbi:MAG: type II secretion system F family protein [Planctomycetes bacterium]|nr:type II secretion system F family protein [Planctomycetota bacterium]